MILIKNYLIIFQHFFLQSTVSSAWAAWSSPRRTTTRTSGSTIAPPTGSKTSTSTAAGVVGGTSPAPRWTSTGSTTIRGTLARFSTRTRLIRTECSGTRTSLPVCWASTRSRLPRWKFAWKIKICLVNLNM